LFEPPAVIIPDFTACDSKTVHANENVILAMLKRRPCTSRQIEQAFGLNINEVLKHLSSLMRRNAIRSCTKANEIYYYTSGREN
jgi:predicted transcriptional regulator